MGQVLPYLSQEVRIFTSYVHLYMCPCGDRQPATVQLLTTHQSLSAALQPIEALRPSPVFDSGVSSIVMTIVWPWSGYRWSQVLLMGWCYLLGDCTRGCPDYSLWL